MTDKVALISGASRPACAMTQYAAIVLIHGKGDAGGEGGICATASLAEMAVNCSPEGYS